MSSHLAQRLGRGALRPVFKSTGDGPKTPRHLLLRAKQHFQPFFISRDLGVSSQGYSLL